MNGIRVEVRGSRIFIHGIERGMTTQEAAYVTMTLECLQYPKPTEKERLDEAIARAEQAGEHELAAMLRGSYDDLVHLWDRGVLN